MAELGIEIDKEKSKQSTLAENNKKGKKSKKTNNEGTSPPETEAYVPTTSASRTF